MVHLFVLKKMQQIDRPYFGRPREVLVKSPDKLGGDVCVRHFINYMEGFHAMGAFVSGDACNQSRVFRDSKISKNRRLARVTIKAMTSTGRVCSTSISPLAGVTS